MTGRGDAGVEELVWSALASHPIGRPPRELLDALIARGVAESDAARTVRRLLDRGQLVLTPAMWFRWAS